MLKTINPMSYRDVLYGGEDGVLFSEEHKGIFFITKQLLLLGSGRSGKHNGHSFNRYIYI